MTDEHREMQLMDLIRPDLPLRSWAMRMSWHDLLFAHWPVDPALLRQHIPAPFEIDTFQGKAWIAVVPFYMTNVTPRFVPPMPCVSAFAELNVRTYVHIGGKRGVWFFSLDAASRVAVRIARWRFFLPYFDARMSLRKQAEGWINYSSRRTHRGAKPAEFIASYRPTGEIAPSQKGTIEQWLTERYWLFSVDRAGRGWSGQVDHVPWPLQIAECRFERNTMTEPLGISLTGDPLLHFARRLDVVAWTIERIDPIGNP